MANLKFGISNVWGNYEDLWPAKILHFQLLDIAQGRLKFLKFLGWKYVSRGTLQLQVWTRRGSRKRQKRQKVPQNFISLTSADVQRSSKQHCREFFWVWRIMWRAEVRNWKYEKWQEKTFLPSKMCNFCSYELIVIHPSSSTRGCIFFCCLYNINKVRR